MRWLVLILLLGCGARTGLEVEESEPCVPTSDVEVCDGADNDCNGLVDDGIAPVRCGEHGCEVTVYCVDGEMASCVPRTPSPEECNLLDDDCDGEVDEGLGFGPLGEAIVLRTDEGSTGECDTCHWAWGTTLAASEDGFFAFWNLSLYGGREQPTLFGRPLDSSGWPTGEIQSLGEDYILNVQHMQALAPLPELGVPLDATFRVGRGEDTQGFLLLSGTGAHTMLQPMPASGARNVPRTVWTGERFVSAWDEDQALRVATVAEDGRDARELDVPSLERVGRVTLGLYPGRVGVLVSNYELEPVERREQWLMVLDAQGRMLTPARQIDAEYATWQRLIGTEEGWLHILPNGWEEPSTRQMLTVEGAAITEAVPFEDGRHIGDSGLQEHIVVRPEQNEIVYVWQDPAGGPMVVEILDSFGDTLRSWSGEVEPDPGYDQGFVVSPHATVIEDRIIVIWHGLSDDGSPNRISVREFGCVP